MREEINKTVTDEVQSLICKLNGFQENTNLTINLIKKIQKVPTQEKLNSAHLLHCGERQYDQQEEFHDRDISLYYQLNDFLDLLKPREVVVVKFFDVPTPILVPYKKTKKYLTPWFNLWMEKFPECLIEYCTDIHSYLNIMGPLCSLINLSNLLNRIESTEINYTFILLSIAIFPKCDISPINRNAKAEDEEIIKSVTYEDVKRKLFNIKSAEDRLFNSKSRNMFGLPALTGSNFVS